MNGRKLTAIIVAATMMGAVGMSGCSQDKGSSGPDSSAAAPPSGETNQGAATSPPVQSTTELLRLNDALKAKLGSAYSDSWIVGGRLYVAVTTQDAAATVSAAGGVPKLVHFNAAQLADALRSVTAWQASLPPEQAAAIHRIISDGRTGTVTIFVAASQMDTISAVAAKAKPAGKVPLAIKVSQGPATPL